MSGLNVEWLADIYLLGLCMSMLVYDTVNAVHLIVIVVDFRRGAYFYSIMSGRVSACSALWWMFNQGGGHSLSARKANTSLDTRVCSKAWWYKETSTFEHGGIMFNGINLMRWVTSSLEIWQFFLIWEWHMAPNLTVCVCLFSGSQRKVSSTWQREALSQIHLWAWLTSCSRGRAWADRWLESFWATGRNSSTEMY